MNRRRMILLVVAMTALALPCSAADYRMERLIPPDARIDVPTGAQVDFKALFSLLFGYGWHEAEWWVDGERVLVDPVLGQHEGVTLFACEWQDCGQHEVKVRAKYDSIPFWIHKWTDYLTWTINVFDPEAYTMNRVNPSRESCSLALGSGPCWFTASFGGLFSPARWTEARWYVDGALEQTEALSGQTAQTRLDWGRDTPGTVEIKVHARRSVRGESVWTDYLTWTVNVYDKLARVSPPSPVTVYLGGTQEFTVLAMFPEVNSCAVDWLLDTIQHHTVFLHSNEGPSGTASWSHTFDNSGTYSVLARMAFPGHDHVVWTVNVIAKRTLTVSSTAGGAVTSPGEGVFEYGEGTEVALEATPDSGYHFTHWSGSVSSTSNPLHVTVDNDYNVTANFAADTVTYTLTISSGAGGAVTSPGEGAFEYAEGTEVMLEATPDEGYHFTHWSGSVSSTSNPLHLTVDNDYNVTANFVADAATYTLTISSSAGGTVTSPGEGAFGYDERTEVTLEATPDDGYYFTHWSGNVSSTSNPLQLTMDNDYNVTANFVLATTALYVDDDAPGDPGPADSGVSDPQEDGTPEHPFDRIQEGVDAADEGSSVIVLAGTYLESIDLRGLAIRLSSADGPEATIINGGGAFHVVQCVSGEGPDTVIEGFSITGGSANGPAPDDLGGGMVNLDSRPTVNNCILSGNLATLGGAGMGNLNSSPVVTNCLFNGNVTVAGIGAGMLNMGGCRPVLTNCTFVGNAATSGHALACDSAGRSRPNNVIITNCILWNGGDEIRCYDSSVLTVAYSDVQGTWPGAGNIAADPVFTLPSVGSWRLWTGSPCIDAGDKTLSMGPSGVWRPAAGTIGGALEFDGVDDCLLSHAMAGTLNGADALTVALWVKSDVTGTDRGFIHFEDPHGTDDRGMRYDASGVDGHGTNLIKIGLTCNARSGRQRGRQQLESSSGVQTTAWQHLAMTWSRGEALKLYINGVLDTPTFNDPGLVGILTGYRKLLIGRGGKYGDPSTDATGWDGLIDDVAVFRRALSAAEVVRLRDQGGASFVGDAGLEGLWELDEWCGCVACDSSGYGRDGWLTSLPATDLDGKTRVLDGDDDGIEAVDMGAYEWEAPPPASGGR